MRPRKTHRARGEFVTDEASISRFNTVLFIQYFFAALVGAQTVYTVLALAGFWRFGWAAMLWISVPVLAVFLVAQWWAFGIYQRQTRTNVADPQAPRTSLPCVGKPLMAEIHVGVLMISVSFFVGLFITVMVVTSDTVEATLEPPPIVDVEKRVREVNLLSQLATTLLNMFLILIYSIAVQWYPIATVTRLTCDIKFD